MNLLQHMKCIEVRLEYAKASTSQKQKYAINNAVVKTRAAINHICDLLGDTNQVLRVKTELEKIDMLHVMVLTEQMFKLPTEDMEEVTEIIDQYLIKKYGTEVESE